MTHLESRERRKKVLESFKSGFSVKEICEMYKLSQAYVYGIGCMSGVLPDNRPLISLRSYYVIADLIQSDDNLETIGARWGLTKQRVSQIYQNCAATGIPVKERHRGRSVKRS